MFLSPVREFHVKPIELPGLITKGDESAWALTSPDDRYRYALGRCWAPLQPVLDVFALNPSRARHDVPDTTMHKLVHFAKREGCGGILIRNLSAFSATDPKQLLRLSQGELWGEYNCELLQLAPNGAGAIHLAAWGNFPTQRLRRDLLRPMGLVKVRRLVALGFTKSGEPKHPCRLAHATPLVPWSTVK